MNSHRDLINEKAGKRHELAQQILKCDWYDTPSSARAVIEYVVAQQAEQHPSTTQQILDLIIEQCRYWHGLDEARRVGFACLYAQAKEIADNAAATALPYPPKAPSHDR